MESDKKGHLVAKRDHLDSEYTHDYFPKASKKGIDSDFSNWSERQDTAKTKDKNPQDLNSFDSHLPNIKDDKAFDVNPVFGEEGDERLPTETLNERETLTRFYDEYTDKKIKLQNRDKRIQSLTRSSISSDNEDRKSRSLERPGKSSSINQFSSQYQFNRETDPAAFKKQENEVSMSKIPLSFNLEDLVKEEEKLTEIFDFLKREWDPSTLCDDWWELTEESCLMSVNKYFKEEKLWRTLNNAMKLQAIVIGYTHFMSNLFPYDSLIKNTFKNLNTYIHQNYLIIILFFPAEITFRFKKYKQLCNNFKRKVKR